MCAITNHVVAWTSSDPDFARAMTVFTFLQTEEVNSAKTTVTIDVHTILHVHLHTHTPGTNLVG